MGKLVVCCGLKQAPQDVFKCGSNPLCRFVHPLSRMPLPCNVPSQHVLTAMEDNNYSGPTETGQTQLYNGQNIQTNNTYLAKPLLGCVAKFLY